MYTVPLTSLTAPAVVGRRLSEGLGRTGDAAERQFVVTPILGGVLRRDMVRRLELRVWLFAPPMGVRPSSQKILSDSERLA